MVVLKANLEVEKTGRKMDLLKAALKVLQKENQMAERMGNQTGFGRLFRGRRLRPPTGMTS